MLKMPEPKTELDQVLPGEALLHLVLGLLLRLDELVGFGGAAEEAVAEAAVGWRRGRRSSGRKAPGRSRAC